MDEKLCKIIRDTFPQVNDFNERIKRLESSILGIETVDEFFLKNILDPEVSASFFKGKAEEIKKDEKVLSGFREQVSIYCDRCFNEAIDFYRYNVSSIRTIILSIKDLIPFKLNKKEKAFSKIIVKATEGLLMHLDALDNVIQTEIDGVHRAKIKKDDKPEKLKLITVKACAPIYSLIELNFLTMACILFHQIVYEYYSVPRKKKAEKVDMTSLIVSALSIYLSPKINDIKNDTEQIIKENKTNNEDLKGVASQILQEQEETKQMIDKQGNQTNLKFETIENKVDQKDRAGKTKPLFLTTCLDAIKEVYDDPKYNYHQQFKLHSFAIRNKLSSWNQYLKNGGTTGEPPLPQFDFYRHTDKETFKKWVRDVFFPDYRNRAHKDALTNASHPDNIDNIYVPAQQDIIDEVDESLANDHHDNTNNKQQDSTSNRNK